MLRLYIALDKSLYFQRSPVGIAFHLQGSSVLAHICVPPRVCVKQFSIGASQLLLSTPNNQELYLIIPPIAMALTFAPVRCLALQSLSHLMKAALHDAIKEQGSF